MLEGLHHVGRFLAVVALGCVAGAAAVQCAHRCTTPPPPPATAVPSSALADAYERCRDANASVVVALEALALREDGCETFTHLAAGGDAWMSYRAKHAGVPRKIRPAAWATPSADYSHASASTSAPDAGARNAAIGSMSGSRSGESR